MKEEYLTKKDNETEIPDKKLENNDEQNYREEDNGSELSFDHKELSDSFVEEKLSELLETDPDISRSVESASYKTCFSHEDDSKNDNGNVTLNEESTIVDLQNRDDTLIPASSSGTIESKTEDRDFVLVEEEDSVVYKDKPSDKDIEIKETDGVVLVNLQKSAAGSLIVSGKEEDGSILYIPGEEPLQDLARTPGTDKKSSGIAKKNSRKSNTIRRFLGV